MDDFINFLHDDEKIAEILDHFPATITMNNDNISNFLFMFGKKIWGEAFLKRELELKNER